MCKVIYLSMNEQLFAYSAVIPLVHNRLAVFSNMPDSACDFVIEGTYTINAEYVIDSGHEIVVCFEIYQEANQTFCRVSGILARDKRHAIETICEMVRLLCIEITFQFIKDDGNLHIHQPRIEADWIHTNWESKPYEDIARVEYDIHSFQMVMPIVHVEESVMITLTTHIRSDLMEMNHWNNPDYSFLVQELYYALGTEHVRSKFFHLFSLVEYCEEHYRNHNKSHQLFTEDEILQVANYIQKQFAEGESKAKKFQEKTNLTKISDIDRVQKLLNILDWMGIHTIVFKGKEMVIDLSMLGRLIRCRNKLFHAENKELEDLQDCVGWLFYIDIQIVQFLRDEANDGTQRKVSE